MSLNTLTMPNEAYRYVTTAEMVQEAMAVAQLTTMTNSHSRAHRHSSACSAVSVSELSNGW